VIVNDNLDASGVRTITTITDTTVTVDVDGQIVETRTPTADELLALQPIIGEPTAEERLSSLVAALADAQSLEEIRDAAAAAGGN